MGWVGDVIFVLRTAPTGFLNRGTLHRSVAAKHTAISSLWFQDAVAIFTFIEELAGIGGHGFFLQMLTDRTCNHGF